MINQEIGKENLIYPKESEPRGESGSALIELALILPLVLTITLTAFEFTRAIHKSSIAASAGKEMASIIVRECNISDYETCVIEQQTKFEDFMQSVAPLIKIQVNYAEFIPGDSYNGIKRTLVFNSNYAGVDDVITSQFSTFINTTLATSGTSADEYSDLDRLSEVFMIEVYIPYDPLLSFTNSIFPFPIANGLLYDATII